MVLRVRVGQGCAPLRVGADVITGEVGGPMLGMKLKISTDRRDRFERDL